MTTKPHRFRETLLALAAAVGCCAHAQQPPALVGVLGQSQAAPEMAAPYQETEGVVAYGADVWTGAGNKLHHYRERPGGGLALVREVTLPSGIAYTPIASDGQSIYAACGDKRIYRVSMTDPAATAVRFAQLTGTPRFITASPPGATGFAAKAPVFALIRNTVLACGGASDGQVLITLPMPERSGWQYQCIGIEPESGDLLAASGYADLHIYRFNASGTQVTTGDWPRNCNALGIASVRGVAWAAATGDVAFSLAPGELDPNAPTLNVPWSNRHNAIAPASDGGYWLATSQGLMRADRTGRPCPVRIGGLPNVSLLAIAADGTVLAASGAGRMVRLMLDDLPDEPFRCNGDDAWRTAERWDTSPAGIVSNGQCFIVAEKKSSQLYRFYPDRTSWGQTPWVKIEDKNAAPLHSLSAIAGGDTILWALNDGAILESETGDSVALHPAPLPSGAPTAIQAIAASDDETALFVASATTVAAFRREPRGVYTPLWSVPASGDCLSLAATRTRVFALDKGGVVTSFDATTGRPLPTKFPDVGQATAIAARGPWLLIADAPSARLLLYRAN
ncbi:MAG: hypothetical protein P4L33_21245 [Capsulimonadaceae bacterium]|nr:hypothetical protein [Capsulimonadaceae bacterium]